MSIKKHKLLTSVSFLLYFLLCCSFVTKKGEHIQFQWFSSECIPPQDEEQMKDIFLCSFLQTYRLSCAYNDLSDQNIRDSLSDDFERLVRPYLRATPHKTFLSAKLDEKLVAYALFESIGDDAIYIAELAVRPEFQHQGIGRKMTFLPLEKEPHLKKMVLVAEKINKQARAFYEALGFLPSEYTHEGYSPDRYCAYEKKL